MEKQQLLNELRQAVNSGLINKSDLAFVDGGGTIPNVSGHQEIAGRLTIPEIFYYIGSLIVFIGLIILVAQNWESLTYPVRVFITLGAGIAFYVSSLLLQKTIIRGLGTALTIVSCLLMPVGYFVLFDPSYNSSFIWISVLISLLCLAQFVITQFITKKEIYTIFNIFFGTWLFFSFTDAVFIGPMFSDKMVNFYSYRIIFAGLSYLLIAYSLNIKKMLFGNFLNSIGTLGILGPAFYFNTVLGQSRNYISASNPSVIWTWLFPILVVSVLYLSIKLKNSAFLFWGTLFFIGYIIRVTGSNFVDTIGWPLSIIIVGVITVALGYFAFFINKRYIKK
ncbi:MAG: hypothetical protein A2541_02435 [Candidatus Taylorbacteria bacterium RIFOXYD2_FULL_36_9]|uniref:Uncharacterized protein n=1 Tax=Candidatus Taylorbacteria bacterium RIFOXYD2_FULL_36_9 TaxID=1802338 RepID=A0A1G2PE12_9BACT|nr:MAG: hypothetical protein A2541_02435 [Candidatus Taylorbacteria bacterium RIFOXYD2_FULL_36_9]